MGGLTLFDSFIDYVIEDIKKKTSVSFQYDDLSSDIKTLVNSAAIIYKKMYRINQMAIQLGSKRKSIFSFQKKKLSVEEEKFKGDYNRLKSEYENMLNEIVKGIENIKKGKPGIVYDFSSIKEIIKNERLILQPLKCPVCGAPLDIPDSGGIITCPYCGSKIKAIDVLEKVMSSLK